MKTYILKEDQLEFLIKVAFGNGETWGVTYSTWFIPTEADKTEHVNKTIDLIKTLIK